jgi:hypothetical protein
MSKEMIEINIHYGQKNFTKLFEELVKSTISIYEPPCMEDNNLSYKYDINQAPSKRIEEVIK